MDYGEGPMVRDPQSGRYRRTRLFVLTLGFSLFNQRFTTTVPLERFDLSGYGESCFSDWPIRLWRLRTFRTFDSTSW